jgi:hypothetical protein
MAPSLRGVETKTTCHLLWNCPVAEANHKKKKNIKLTKRINT